MKIITMTVVRYYRDDRPWTEEQIENPAWDQIEKAVRAMDNYCFPIVKLYTSSDPYDQRNILNIVGGDGRWALFDLMGEWEYSDNSLNETEVRLWASDQGYLCKEQNVIKSISLLLRYVRAFCETASYQNLKALG